ncbi:ankyrin repeat-containing domain protein [Pavlovales sp. CCMP2436]|nr:ankyrin repeat-containing domain protein [Pavlovales sp. CCMP2436]
MDVLDYAGEAEADESEATTWRRRVEALERSRAGIESVDANERAEVSERLEEEADESEAVAWRQRVEALDYVLSRAGAQSVDANERLEVGRVEAAHDGDAALWRRKAEALERTVTKLIDEEHRLAGFLAAMTHGGTQLPPAPVPAPPARSSSPSAAELRWEGSAAVLPRFVPAPPAAPTPPAEPALPSAAELHWAVATEDVEGLRRLLERGSDAVLLASTDSHGRSALHSAAASGRAELVDSLVGHGARVSLRDAEGSQPLHLACDGHSVSLLIAARADVHAKDAAGRTPLVRARAEGQSLAARALAHFSAVAEAANAPPPRGVVEEGIGPTESCCIVSQGLLLLTLHALAPCGLTATHSSGSGSGNGIGAWIPEEEDAADGWEAKGAS